MRINGCRNTRVKNGLWGVGRSERVEKEIMTRQRYAKSRGIDFDCDTVVTKAKKRPSERKKPKNVNIRQSSQLKIGSYGAKAKSAGANASSSFFKKIIEDIDCRDSKKEGNNGKKWSECVSPKVSEDKRASLEKSLGWMEKRFEENGKKESPDPLDELPRIDSDIGGHTCCETFSRIRQRVANLLLHDLPHEVTEELRAVGRDLERLSVANQ